MQAVVIWGSQLLTDYHSALQANPTAPVILIESKDLSRRFKYHKQKLLFVLTAMRDYGDELRASGRTVWYSQLEDSDDDWFETLGRICRQHDVDQLIAMRQNDKAPQRRLEQWTKRAGIKLAITTNTMFLTTTSEFNEWADDQKGLQMERFYRWQRKRLNILLDDTGKPVGGKWNYDHENRKSLPKDLPLPTIKLPVESKHAPAVKKLIDTYFDDHPGSYETNWLPTSRSAARKWLDEFVATRFKNFGDYEDAMKAGESFLFHSAISALLNIGLLHPKEVIAATLAPTDIPLASREGFIRQIIGWREFMFGLYHYKPDDWKDANFLQQEKPLPEWWWKLSGAPEPPLQDALTRLYTYGYSHHIERLMLFGNYMLLADYHPRQVYDWFMTMYVDAYEWVMVPNVIGMSQYADGGLDNGGFATKPYISGSNYLQKMGRWWPTASAAKDSEWTTMYWAFLERHQHRLANNYRLRPLLTRFKKE